MIENRQPTISDAIFEGIGWVAIGGVGLYVGLWLINLALDGLHVIAKFIGTGTF